MMKSYARRNKRSQLNIKYRLRGMAKSNTRKLGRRRRNWRLTNGNKYCMMNE